MYFAKINSWYTEDKDNEINVLCEVVLPDNMGGGIRGPYPYLAFPHSQIFPYIGMNVQVYTWAGFGVCFAVTQDLTSTSKLEPKNAQIGAIEQGVSITFTKDTIQIGLNTVKNVIINAQNVTVNTDKAVVNATDTEINGKNIALNVDEVTCSGNITVQGDVKAGNISLQNHKHTVTALGSPTSPPTP